MKNEFIENDWPCHVPDRSLDEPFLLQGSANFHSRNNITLLQRGDLLTLHKNVEHTLTANEGSVILLTIAVCPADPI
jgi:quercetin dioxygenase-like cupin family protein